MSFTARISKTAQNTPEWLEERSKLFTASEAGIFLIEPKPTKVQVKARASMIRKKLEAFTEEGKLWAAEENRKMPYLFDVKRGNELEPAARALYSKITGNEVVETGLCIHESSIFDAESNALSGFGCSPDGLIPCGEEWLKGVEIKCVRPATIMEWIDDGVLPEKHSAQVHISMAVTGLREWDFFAYAPDMPPLLIHCQWSEITDKYLSSLKQLHADFLAYRAKLAKLTVVEITQKITP